MLSGKILNLCWALVQSNQRFLTSCVVRFLGIRGNTERLDCLGLLVRAPRFHCRRGSVLAEERLSCLLISGAVRRLLSYPIRASRTFRRRCAFGHGLKLLPRPAKKHRDSSRELVECPFNTEPFRSFGRPGHGVTFVVSHFASDEATWLGLLSLPGDGSGPLTLQRASPVGAPRMPAPPFAVHGRAISHLVGARRPTGCAGQSDVSSSRILLGRSIPVFLALLVRNSAR